MVRLRELTCSTGFGAGRLLGTDRAVRDRAAGCLGWLLPPRTGRPGQRSGGYVMCSVRQPSSFAITRTAGRYAEGYPHNAVLDYCGPVVRLFSTRPPAHGPARWRSAPAARLVVDIDLLDPFPLRILPPWLWASLLLVGVLVMLGLLDSAVAGGDSCWRPGCCPGSVIGGSCLAEPMVMAEQQHRKYLLDSLRCSMTRVGSSGASRWSGFE